MDPSHLKRLKDEEHIAILQTEENIKQWEKYRSDYVALRDRMKTLPDKLSHDIMVPFGSLAFMPGKIVDTNRILVLLGDNWFAERSAKQACEIVDRRLEAVDGTIKDLSAQKRLLDTRVDFTTELTDVAESRGGVTEITEEYDPEKEKLWREQHRKNVQRHRQQMAASKQKEVNTESKSSEEDLWAKLDELAIQERLGHEMAKLDEEPSTTIQNTNTFQPEVNQKQTAVPNTVSNPAENESTHKDLRLSKSVSWEDDQDDTQPYENSNTDSDDEGDSSEEEDENGTMSTKIIFLHSPREDESPAKETSSGDTSHTINSPRDIYRQFYKPASILKPTSHTHVEEPPPEIVRERVIVSGSQSAFSGNIVERSVSDTTLVSAEPPKPKRVSKFKQMQNAKR